MLWQCASGAVSIVSWIWTTLLYFMRIMANYNKNNNNRNRDRERENYSSTLVKRQSKMLVVSGFWGAVSWLCHPTDVCVVACPRPFLPCPWPALSCPARGCFSYFHVIYTKLRSGSFWVAVIEGVKVQIVTFYDCVVVLLSFSLSLFLHSFFSAVSWLLSTARTLTF